MKNWWIALVIAFVCTFQILAQAQQSTPEIQLTIASRIVIPSDGISLSKIQANSKLEWKFPDMDWKLTQWDIQLRRNNKPVLKNAYKLTNEAKLHPFLMYAEEGDQLVITLNTAHKRNNDGSKTNVNVGKIYSLPISK